MSKPLLTGNKNYHQGIYKPRNPEKYLGNPTNIIYRSGWEKYFLQWCDMTPSVVKYGSEELVIPYISPIDGTQHRYFIDFIVYIHQKDNTIGKFAVEIKPYAQTRTPKVPKKNTIKLYENYQYQLKTYSINQAKWKAATEFCKRNGMSFIILTENNLLKKKK